jgi:hypothetical protein
MNNNVTNEMLWLVTKPDISKTVARGIFGLSPREGKKISPRKNIVSAAHKIIKKYICQTIGFDPRYLCIRFGLRKRYTFIVFRIRTPEMSPKSTGHLTKPTRP